MSVTDRYDYWGAIWPGYNRPAPIAPVRVGVDRRTGKLLFGFDHVFQSMQTIYATRYHERTLRRWVGSLVPHLLGQNETVQYVTRFYFAMASALDLFEPGYRIKRVHVANREPARIPNESPLTTVTDVRRGAIKFQHIGTFYPRGHLGEFTPEDRRGINLLQRDGRWEGA